MFFLTPHWLINTGTLRHFLVNGINGKDMDFELAVYFVVFILSLNRINKKNSGY